MQIGWGCGRWLAAMLAVGALLGILAGCSRQSGPVNFVAEGKPEHLSDWHVLQADGKRLTLNTGVLPYDLNTPLFTDYAHKLRTVWMPAGKAANYSATEAFEFPVGTIISKTFYYPRVAGAAHAAWTLRQTYDDKPDFAEKLAGEGLNLENVRLVETRLLVRRDNGWVAMPYVWNEEQTEATLARTGERMDMELVADDGKKQGFAYVVPNENQCASCHVTTVKDKQLRPIGLKARHLNRDYAYVAGSENQLAYLVRAGYLSGLPTANVQNVPRAANWRDESATLVARARAYLDINCAHCHSPTGPANTTALTLNPFVPGDRSVGVCKPPVAAGKGTGDRLFGIVPGQPDASIMMYRVASTEGGVMMPELGRSSVHAEGVALLRQWITAMPGACTAVDSRP
jgi:uncharacterized repeat protein (TIGR03806 family)